MSDQPHDLQQHSDAYYKLQEAYPIFLALLGLFALMLIVYAGWRFIRKDSDRKFK